ncbi:hypothetical protein [Klebsiella pneumoniae]|uniref:hypothetical protein n=1 Tax=Klebsiella pneumoniae TaxID=573 RepID=UPI000E2A9AF4|nr:hypothetical protein [Klebsiella pneumoniae]SWX05606.1 Uncharacterised protein [Klebsiella pneumoniae]
MTDITELAQSHELLIANGQQTADLLRHLADNEIDSDYFAVVSECESYGKETDAELSITEFALRAAGYVDALVEALEKAQQERDNWRTSFDNERFRADKLKAHIDEMTEERTASINELSRIIQKEVKAKREAEKRIAELEAQNTVASLPGGFSIEESRSLQADLVRSHISKALSGEKMKSADKNADLQWIHSVIVRAAWFVKASVEATAGIKVEQLS